MASRKKNTRKQPSTNDKSERNVSSNPPTGERDVLDMDQAIALLKTTRPTFYRWLRAGRIKGMKAGRQWRFYKADVEHFLQGEQPRIDLPVSIEPLIRDLHKKLSELEEPPLHSGDNTILRAVSLMILLAHRSHATDIHIAPMVRTDATDPVGTLRMRIDGALGSVMEFDARLIPAVMERWKIMANCDTHETARPQDGRIVVSLPESGQRLDIRVSFMPTVLGESLTVRPLRQPEAQFSLDHLDYSPRDRRLLERTLEAREGLVIVSGPSGSGKTTTLYSCLHHLSGPTRKIMCVEDPVEYVLPGISQTPVNEKAGLTFAIAARSILRADPDVVMIGEVRDAETLAFLHQTALTGHLALTSLHTNDAPAALKRMVDLGLAPFMVADSARLIIAQRLVRTLCPECSVEAPLTTQQCEQAMRTASAGGLTWPELPKKFRKQVGCQRCAQTGYRGRMAITEMLEVTADIGAALRREAPIAEIREIAIRQGMTTMACDGLRRAANGQTTLSEVLIAAPHE